MFEVKVTVEIPGLPEAINSLARTLSIGQTHVVCNQNDENSQHIDMPVRDYQSQYANWVETNLITEEE